MEAKELGILKDRFSGFEYPVNEAIWRRIEARPAKPNKSYGKFLAIAASFALLMVIGYSLNQRISGSQTIISNPTSIRDKGIRDIDLPVQNTGPAENTKKIAKTYNPNPASPSILSKKINLINETQGSPLAPTIAEVAPNNPLYGTSQAFGKELQGNTLGSGEENALIDPGQQVSFPRGASVKIQLVFSDHENVAQEIKNPRINFAKLKRKFKKEINLKKMKDKAKSIFVLGKKDKKTSDETDSNNREVNLN